MLHASTYWDNEMKSIVLIYQRFNQLPNKTKLGCVAFAGLIFFGSFLSVILASNAAPQDSFVKAYKAVPEEILKKAIAENYFAPGNASLDPKTVEVFEVSGRSGKKFFIFNFNTPNLCGISGCLYAVYNSTGEEILSLYLQPNLPENFKLFDIQERLSDDLPCLVISQPNSSNGSQKVTTVFSSQYCYQENTRTMLRISYQQQPVQIQDQQDSQSLPTEEE